MHPEPTGTDPEPSTYAEPDRPVHCRNRPEPTGTNFMPEPDQTGPHAGTRSGTNRTSATLRAAVKLIPRPRRSGDPRRNPQTTQKLDELRALLER